MPINQVKNNMQLKKLVKKKQLLKIQRKMIFREKKITWKKTAKIKQIDLTCQPEDFLTGFLN